LGPLGHTVVSVGIGTAVWTSTGSPVAIPVAFAAGVLPDIDHIIDFLDSKDEGRRCHMFRPFHGWEYFLVSLAMVLAFYSDPLLWAAVLGYLSHLVIDQITNRTHLLAYSIIYRAMKGFRRRHLTPSHFDGSYVPPEGPVPFWGRLEPSFWRLLTRLRGG
jgi:hypothetical protein